MITKSGSPAYLLPQKQFAQLLLQEEDARLNSVDYVAVSMPRFEYTISICRRLKPYPDVRVLDIGRSYLSFMLASHYNSVTTLGMPLGDHGFAHEYKNVQENRPPHDHIVFDLNDTQTKGIFSAYPFDLIVFAEVLEHLYTAPELVLHALGDLMSADALLICQTPNAAALPKRLRLIRGINPYERIRISRDNPGHFREYTKSELVQIGWTAGLEVAEHSYNNYTVPARRLPRSKSDIFQLLCWLNPVFSLGQTVIFRKRGVEL